MVGAGHSWTLSLNDRLEEMVREGDIFSQIGMYSSRSARIVSSAKEEKLFYSVSAFSEFPTRELVRRDSGKSAKQSGEKSGLTRFS